DAPIRLRCWRPRDCQPICASARSIGRVPALGDNAWEAGGANLAQKLGGISGCMNRMQASELRLGDETGKSLFALEERRRPHGPAAQAEQIEGEEEEVAAGDRGWSLPRAGFSSLRALRWHNEAVQKR